MRKSLLPLTLILTVLGSYFIPTSASAAPSFSLTWDSVPVTGQPSPAFTFRMAGVVPTAGTTLHKVQLYVYDDLGSAFWGRSSASNCFTAANCGIESVTYDGAPISFSVQNWITAPGLSVSNKGFLLTFTPGAVDGTSITSPGDLDSGGVLLIRVASGQFTVPTSPTFSGKPQVSINNKLPAGTGGLHLSNQLGSEITGPAAPGSAGTPSATPGDGSASIAWEPPSTGGTPVTYTVTSNPDGLTCTATHPTTSCVVTGLTNGTSYTFSVIAANEGGNSSPSSSSSSVTPSAPSQRPPSVLSVKSQYFVAEGFPKFKSTLSESMKRFISKEIYQAGSSQTKVVCTGTVRGKTWTSKREALALARATAGCDYIKTLLPSVETELKKRLMSKKKQNSLTVRIRVFY